MLERPSTRTRAPPGGHTTISFGDHTPDYSTSSGAASSKPTSSSAAVAPPQGRRPSGTTSLSQYLNNTEVQAPPSRKC